MNSSSATLADIEASGRLLDNQDQESDSKISDNDLITLRVKTTNDSNVLDIKVNKSLDIVADLKQKISDSLSAYGKNIRLICSGKLLTKLVTLFQK